MKALIIRPGALGDTLMLMPALRQLGSGTEITLVARSPGLEILRPYVHRALNYEGSGWHGLYLEKPDVLPPLPQADVAVAFLTDPEGLAARNLRARLRGAAVHRFSPFPPQGERTHVAAYVARCLERAGLPIDAGKAFSTAERRALLAGNAASPRDGLLFHPGSGSPLKNFPPDFWIALIRSLKNAFPRHPSALLLGPAEEPLFSFYRQNLSGTDLSFLFSPGPERLMERLATPALFLGHDSGVTHLSAMLGTPTLALFKNSSAEQWKPLGPFVRVMEGSGIEEGLLHRIEHAAGEMMDRMQGTGHKAQGARFKV